MLGAHWILANQNRFQMLDNPDNSSFPAADPGLANSRNALFGINDNEEEVAVSGPGRKRFAVGDLH